VASFSWHAGWAQMMVGEGEAHRRQKGNSLHVPRRNAVTPGGNSSRLAGRLVGQTVDELLGFFDSLTYPGWP
jgi:hypothetical protein